MHRPSHVLLLASVVEQNHSSQNPFEYILDERRWTPRNRDERTTLANLNKWEHLFLCHQERMRLALDWRCIELIDSCWTAYDHELWISHSCLISARPTTRGSMCGVHWSAPVEAIHWADGSVESPMSDGKHRERWSLLDISKQKNKRREKRVMQHTPASNKCTCYRKIITHHRMSMSFTSVDTEASRGIMHLQNRSSSVIGLCLLIYLVLHNKHRDSV